MIPTVETTASLAASRESILGKLVETADLHARSGSRTRRMGRVATEHGYAGTKLGATEGDHVFSV